MALDIVMKTWNEVLGVEATPDANFFESGGHSLLAMQVIARLRERLGVPVKVRLLLEHPVLSDFANQVAALQR